MLSTDLVVTSKEFYKDTAEITDFTAILTSLDKKTVIKAYVLSNGLSKT